MKNIVDYMLEGAAETTPTKGIMAESTTGYDNDPVVATCAIGAAIYAMAKEHYGRVPACREVMDFSISVRAKMFRPLSGKRGVSGRGPDGVEYTLAEINDRWDRDTAIAAAKEKYNASTDG